MLSVLEFRSKRCNEVLVSRVIPFYFEQYLQVSCFSVGVAQIFDVSTDGAVGTLTISS